MSSMASRNTRLDAFQLGNLAEALGEVSIGAHFGDSNVLTRLKYSSQVTRPFSSAEVKSGLLARSGLAVGICPGLYK